MLSRLVHQTLAITWNVNEQRPDHSSLFRMIRERAPDTQTLMVALQEVEMGGSSVALAAAKDAMAKGLQAGPQTLIGSSMFSCIPVFPGFYMSLLGVCGSQLV